MKKKKIQSPALEALMLKMLQITKSLDLTTKVVLDRPLQESLGYVSKVRTLVYITIGS
jgi:hypothetical protein